MSEGGTPVGGGNNAVTANGGSISLSSTLRSSSLSRASTNIRWTPKTPAEHSQRYGGTRESTSFLAPTRFNQEMVGGTVPKVNSDKRANTATSPEVEVVIPFKHRFIA